MMAAWGSRTSAGLDRGVPKDDLEVLGQQEQHAEEGQEGQGDRPAGRRESGVLEEPHVEHRVGVGQLPGQEGDEQDGADAEGQQNRRRLPPVGRALDDRPEQGPEGGDGEQGAARIELGPGRIPGIGDEEVAADETEDDDGNVDKEHRSPPEMGEQHAPDDGAQSGQAGHAGPQPDGLGPLPGVGEHVGQDGERRRHDEGTACAHARPGEDQDVGRFGERREQRSGAEHGEADDEAAVTSEAVTEAPCRQEQPGEDDGVGVDDPLQLARRGAEASLGGLLGQCRQGDVEDGVVEDDDEQAHAEDRQRHPPVPVDPVRVPQLRSTHNPPPRL